MRETKERGRPRDLEHKQDSHQAPWFERAVGYKHFPDLIASK